MPLSESASSIESHVIPQWIEEAATGVIVEVNHAARVLLGVNAIDAGMSSSRWLPDSVRPAADPDTGWIPGVVLLLTADGARRPVRLCTRPLSLAQGEALLVMVLPATDAETESSTTISALAALNASERQFRHMAENVPGALFQYLQHSDGRNRVTYMSPRCHDLWEVPPEAIEADSSVLWRMVHPDDLPGMAASVAESGRSMERWYWEWRIITPSGKMKWLQGTGRPRRIDADTMAWDSFILDVTDRRRSDEEQRLLRAQLRHAQQLEAIGRLAGGIAHDVNNMLTVVIGFAESAIQSLPDASAAREDLAEILSAASRSAGLTRQLLAFARQQPSSPEVLDLAERLEDSSTLLQRLVGARVEIALVLDADVSPVDIDPSQFDQIVTNLVINARDAIPDDGLITLRLHGDGDEVVLEVADTGTGMDAETLARIYEPFFTTKPDGQGTGLGLATVFGIVAERGGTISVASDVGKGTTFTVRLPRALRSAPPPDSVADSEHGELPQDVLLCEDDPQLRRVVHQLLERRGMRVRSAASPTEAIELARISPPQLLVTDVVTGGRGGIALSEALRELHVGMPVVYITGYVADDLARRAIESGTDQVLRKPFRGAELVRAVGRAWAARP